MDQKQNFRGVTNLPRDGSPIVGITTQHMGPSKGKGPQRGSKTVRDHGPLSAKNIYKGHRPERALNDESCGFHFTSEELKS